MRNSSRPHLTALTSALVAFALAAPARAQFATQCDSCAGCTSALAAPRARIELSQDIANDGDGPCIVVRGDGAQFNGREHAVRARGDAPAVRLEGPNEMARNVHVPDGAVGIEVASAAGAVVFHNTLHVRDVGIRVRESDGVRVSRSEITSGRVGIAFGDLAGGRCADGEPLRSPGAVVHRNHVDGATVGVAACDATPVFTQNTLRNNGIGLLLGSPARGTGASPAASGPYDACACAPALDHVHTGTALLFSTGCGGCLVHEGWLPQLRATGHDVRVRETGTEHLDAARRYDDFIDRCAPEITDAVGVPGCVPNYTCLANNVVFKTRAADDSLDFEAQLNSPEDVAQFAEACTAAATQNFGTGHSCMRFQFRENVICDNRDGDIRAAPGAQRLPGSGDACRRAEGFSDGAATGCANPCTADAVAGPHPSAPSQPSADQHAAPTNVPANPQPLPIAPPSAPDTTTESTVEARPATPRGPFGLSRNALYGIGAAALAGLVGVIARSSRKVG